MARAFRERALVQLVLVRYREFFREPEAVFWVFVFPILLAAGLGIAFSRRAPEKSPVGLTEAAADLRAALEADTTLAVSVLADSAATRGLRAGRLALVVARNGDGVVYRFDPARPESQVARLAADAALQRHGGRTDPVTTTDEVRQEPGARYIDWVIPGLLGMNLLGSGMWGLGFTIVDSRRKKLLKRLIATPMPRGQYLASFLISRLSLLVVEVAVFLGFGMVAFGVPMRGAAGTFILLCLLSALTFSALGLLVASRAQTVEGVSGLMNLVMLPMWIFSGVFFSSERFPAVAQPLIQALPLTAAVDAFRLHMLEGAGLAALLPELGILAAWLVVSFTVALRIFRWR